MEDDYIKDDEINISYTLKTAESEEIARQTAEYLANGGVITQGYTSKKERAIALAGVNYGIASIAQQLDESKATVKKWLNEAGVKNIGMKRMSQEFLNKGKMDE